MKKLHGRDRNPADVLRESKQEAHQLNLVLGGTAAVPLDMPVPCEENSVLGAATRTCGTRRRGTEKVTSTEAELSRGHIRSVRLVYATVLREAC